MMMAISPAYSSITEQKSRLRREVLSHRRAMGSPNRDAASAIICDKILALPAYQKAKCIAGFAPMTEEVNIWPVLADAKKNNKTIGLPRVASKTSRKITFHEYHDQDELVSGYKGIVEPAADSPQIFPQLFDLCIVPAVAIGKNKKRLGYGGGFYDILISELADFTVLLTPIFHCQLVSTIPCEPHDQRVGFIITEE